MFSVNLTICALFVFITTLLLLISRKEDYWKMLLFTSLMFFSLVVREGVFLVFYIASFVYFFSWRVYRSGSLGFRWWMILIVLLPLIVKKVFLPEYQFNELISRQLTGDTVLNTIGLSYISFNAISYLVDVKRGYIVPETNYFRVLLYLVYFPIVFSGPLTRAKVFFTEVSNIQFNQVKIIEGLRLILWGLFKNLVVAARLNVLLDQLILMNLYGATYLLVGLVFFLFLYCSFSSVINIFQGISLMFNIRIQENFASRIYFSNSREEFWRGWHITLNGWFRDYVFYEIVTLDKKQRYTNFLLFVTFLCIALWHDVTWVFFIWGLCNATWLILERKYKRYFTIGSRHSWLGVFYHLGISSFLATIFIAKDISTIIERFWGGHSYEVAWSQLLVPNTIILIVAFVFMDYFEKRAVRKGIGYFLAELRPLSRYAIYYILVFFILFFMIDSSIVNYYGAF